MAKKEQILELLNAYKSYVDNFSDAVFPDKFDVLAEDIVKLFPIPVVVGKSEQLCEHEPFNSAKETIFMKCLKIEKAKRLEDSMSMFSNPSNELIKDEWELQNEDGTKHQKSHELMFHIENLKKAKQFINELLG